MQHIIGPPKKSKSNWIIVLILIITLATLPFHYALEYGKIFPKEQLSFSNTFISGSDINNLIERYNNANIIEQNSISQEPLFRKLMELGLISNENERENISNYPASKTNMEFEYLKELDGVYPYEINLFEQQVFSQRLKEVLGNKYDFFIENFNVQTPIKIKDDFFIANGCQQHNCGFRNFTIIYDFSKDIMNVGINDDGERYTCTENGVKTSMTIKWENFEF